MEIWKGDSMINYTTEVVGRRFFLYNTVCEVILHRYNDDPHKLLDDCENIAINVQKILNLYDSNSELSLMNRNYSPGVPYPISKDLYAILIKMHRFSNVSQGAFDATIGPLVKLWDFTSKNPKIPKHQDIKEAKLKTGYELMNYNDDETTVEFSIPNMIVDAGGAGKGYAVGLVKEYLENKGVLSASINFGGNLYLIGKRKTKDKISLPWKIGIQRPWLKRGDSIGSLTVEDLGVATSGGYDRFFKKNGKLYQHILNPSTGYPIESDLLSVTIVCDIPIMTDLVSTAFYVLGISKGSHLLIELRKTMYIEFIAITQDGVIASQGLKEKFESDVSIEFIN